MPPVFGIIQSNLQTADPLVIGRMKTAARYLVPRDLQSLNIPGMTAVAALRNNSPESVNHALFSAAGLGIAADASLYNRKELLSRLGNGNLSERSGDAEIILRAYEKWGSRCLQFLYGDFAFVIFNTQTGEIFCGRDPLGVRPLF
jgi:glutamine phosphoribosylpyrophosphate amidotransferase